jgi:plasmid stabilization system protein ParE
LPVIWRAKALTDVGRIVRHIAEDNPVAARRIGRELLLAGDSLELFPIAAELAATLGHANWSSCIHI